MAKHEFEFTDDEWRNRLSPEVYNILRKKGTEPPFSGKYLNSKEKGTYTCAGCGEALFDSDAKYDSKSGWPSFKKPHQEKSISEKTDASHDMVRKEVLCSRCHSHLGHVFDDGPGPAGKRYCINSLALRFKKD